MRKKNKGYVRIQNKNNLFENSTYGNNFMDFYRSRDTGEEPEVEEVPTDEPEEDFDDDPQDDLEDDKQDLPEIKEVKVEFSDRGFDTKIEGKNLIFNDVGAQGYVNVISILEDDDDNEENEIIPKIELEPKNKNQDVFRIRPTSSKAEKDYKSKSTNEDDSNRRYSREFEITQVKDVTRKIQINIIGTSYFGNKSSQDLEGGNQEEENEEKESEESERKKDASKFLVAKKNDDEECKEKYELDVKNSLIGTVILTLVCSICCCCIMILIWLGIIASPETRRLLLEV